MKYLNNIILPIILVLIYTTSNLNDAFAQVTCSATGNSGSGYPALSAATLGIESPDCEHPTFGPHVTQEYDEGLDRNVFVFFSHISDDSDRCQVFDRVRMEVKGGPNTSPELQHTVNETSYYRWKFRLPINFKGASSFNHIFQNKAKGGNDDSFPVITLTARTSVLELTHNGGSTGVNLGALAAVNLDYILGQWIEVYMKQVHAENGKIEVTLKNMATGATVLEYINNDIDLWRTGADYNRPKWGMYRAKNSILKDEEIKFNDFCISEVDSSFCPGEAVNIPDTIPPTTPENLISTGQSRTTVDLTWNTAIDLYGVAEYDILQDSQIVMSTSDTFTAVENLNPQTSYTFTVQARDEAGNISDLSNPLMVATDSAHVLPDIAGQPFPADSTKDVRTSVVLNWSIGANTDSFYVYFGQDSNPPLVSRQLDNEFPIALDEFSTYYWRIGAINSNGESKSNLWTFTTGSSNPDHPWQAYRGEQRPEVETNFLVLNEAPANPPIDEVVVDPNGSTNTFYAFRSNTEEEFRWRNDFSPTDSVITIVARLQAVDPNVNGICYFEVRANGWRQKVRINQSSIKLERATPAIEVDLPFDLTNELHLFRMVSDGKITRIYLDENPTAFASATSDTPTSIHFFEWGKSGGQDYGAIIDWLVIDKSGGFAPGEGEKLPTDLFLSSMATLDTILVDGELLPNFHPNTTDYHVVVTDHTVPQLVWNTTSPLATVIVDNPSTVPNTTAVLTVTAQDGFTKETYNIHYVSPSATHEQETTSYIRIFPNPATNKLNVQLEGGHEGVASIVSLPGIAIKKGIILKNNSEIDISGIPAGTYILTYEESTGKTFSQLFEVK